MQRLKIYAGVIFLLGSGSLNGSTDAVVSAELTRVVEKPLEKTTILPGELKPYQVVDIHAKITGFVNSIEVDRGSRVKAGDSLAVMIAPEWEARRLEAQARLSALQAQLGEAQAKLAGAESTYERLKAASQTPGVVAANDVVVAGKEAEAYRARLESLEKGVEAAEAAVRTAEQMERYLRVTAPFDGVITERHAHIGALAGPEGDGRAPLFRIEQMNRLRLLAPVPEAHTQSIRRGTRVRFTVPAYPGETFSGVVARPADSVDPETRTMPVELDVDNSAGKLTPGMYAEISWPLRRKTDSLFVPPTAVQATTERIFVIRVRDGKAEWVDVRRGSAEENLIEVFGDLNPGDTVVLRATDEIRPGTRIEAK